MGETFLLISEPRSTALRALNYSPATEAFKRKGKLKRCERLGDLVLSMGPAYGSVFTRLDCHKDYGVELVSQSDMFATEPHGRIIRKTRCQLRTTTGFASGKSFLLVRALSVKQSSSGGLSLQMSAW